MNYIKFFRIISSGLFVSAALFPLSSIAQDVDFESLEGRAGYSVGVNIGMNLQGQGIAEDLDTNAVLMGIADGLNGQLKISEAEIVTALQEFALLQQEKAEVAIAQEAETNQRFLIENAAKPGVAVTQSGLQYSILSKGTVGGASPTNEDVVRVHYHGTLPNGTVFDSSVEQGDPVSFPVSGVIPGWTEGLQLMSVGDKFQFVIPSDLAYGSNGAGGVIAPNATLIFDVELLGIE